MSLADDDADDGRTIVRVVDVWECHQSAVAVFQLCPVAGIGHMGGVHWAGIEPSEIASACFLLRQPRPQWPALAEDVAFMGACVARERNEKAATRRRA